MACRILVPWSGIKPRALGSESPVKSQVKAESWPLDNQGIPHPYFSMCQDFFNWKKHSWIRFIKIWRLLHLAASYFDIHPCCNRYQNLIPFNDQTYSIVLTDRLLFTHSLLNEHWIVPTSAVLWTVLQWTYVPIRLPEHLFIISFIWNS